MPEPSHTYTVKQPQQTAETDKHWGLNSWKHVCFSCLSHGRPYIVCQKSGMEYQKFTHHLFHLCIVKGRHTAKQDLIFHSCLGEQRSGSALVLNCKSWPGVEDFCGFVTTACKRKPNFWKKRYIKVFMRCFSGMIKPLKLKTNSVN